MTKIRSDHRAVSELVAFEKNAKHHPASQVAAIAASIQRFGFKDPIGVTESGVIVEGHGRLLAAKELGIETVPVIVFPDDIGEAEIDLYRIAHNRLALISTFDFTLLADELRDIVTDTAAFTEMGFSQAAADNLFQMFGQSTPAPQSVPQGEGGVNAPSENLNTNAFSFDIVWDTKDQQDRWRDFMTAVMARQPNATRGAALNAFMADVMSGRVAPCADGPEPAATAENVGGMGW